MSTPRIAEIAEDFDQFFRWLAEADHDAALRDHAGRKFLGVLQQIERALVARAGAHRAIQPGHGFRVVIEDVRPGIEHDAQRFFEALEIGDQNFDPAIGREFTNLADGLGENPARRQDCHRHG